MAHRRESWDNVSLTGLPSSCLLLDAPFDMHSFDKAFVTISTKYKIYLNSNFSKRFNLITRS